MKNIAFMIIFLSFLTNKLQAQLPTPSFTINHTTYLSSKGESFLLVYNQLNSLEKTVRSFPLAGCFRANIYTSEYQRIKNSILLGISTTRLQELSSEPSFLLRLFLNEQGQIKEVVFIFPNETKIKPQEVWAIENQLKKITLALIDASDCSGIGYRDLHLFYSFKKLLE